MINYQAELILTISHLSNKTKQKDTKSKDFEHGYVL